MPELFILIGILMVMFFFMSRGQKKMMEKAQERRDSALEVGKTVQTSGGFIGTIVDIDGGVITLESLSGDESQWIVNAIVGEIDPPYEHTYADNDDETDTELEDESRHSEDRDDWDGISPDSNNNGR